MEFPAVSQTRLEFWKKPQFTRTGMWWFTLIFGFIGLHHFILRSPQTGLIFIILNFLTLGYPWLYDLIQLSSTSSGGLGTEHLNKYGMDHPWGAMGLAQGMWLPEGIPPPPQEASDPPSPWWFLLYCITLPISIMAMIIAGDNNNAFIRFLFLTIIPFGVILYTCAAVYDYWCLLAHPADLVFGGTRRFFPFTVLGWHKNGHSPNIISSHEVTPCPPDNLVVSAVKLLPPILSIISPQTANNVEAAIKTATAVKETVVDGAIQTGTAVVNTGMKVGQLANELPAAGNAALAGVDGSIQALQKEVANANVPKTKIPKANSQTPQGKTPIKK